MRCIACVFCLTEQQNTCVNLVYFINAPLLSTKPIGSFVVMQVEDKHKNMTHLKAGDKAPDFSGLNEKGELIQLSDYAGQKLVLFFYPKDNTPTCTEEVCNLRDNYQSFTSKGYAVLGVSPDSQRKHTNFIKKFELPFPLIADTEQVILNAYGVWGEKQMFGKKYMGVFRTTFIINEEGTIEEVITKVKAKEHSDQILK